MPTKKMERPKQDICGLIPNALILEAKMLGRDKRKQPLYRLTVELDVTRMDSSVMGFHQEIATGIHAGRPVSYTTTCGFGAPAICIAMKRTEPREDRRLFKDILKVGFGLTPLLEAITVRMDEIDEAEEIEPPQKPRAL